MESQLIRKDLFEVHKPSGQISAKLTKNGTLHQLTPLQFDTINFMCYKSREFMHKKYNGESGLKKEIAKFNDDDDAVFNFLSSQEFELDLDDLIIFTNSYKENRSKIFKAINDLKEITVEMGLFKQHDLSVEHKFSLLRRYAKIDNSTVKFRLEPEILVGWLFTTKPFSKMYLKIQASLKHTYTKILYENLKDYEKKGVVSKPLKLWNYILGFDSSSSNLVSTLKRDYLNKSIKEINANTDIFIDSIDSDKVDNEVYMVIKFHNQDCLLLEKPLVDEMTDKSVKDQLIDNMIDIEARKRLEQAKLYGKKITNESAWLATTKASISKTSIEHKILLDEWIKTDFVDELDFNNYLEEVSVWYTGKNKSKLNISLFFNDYKLVDVFTNKEITTNETETLELFRKFGEVE